MRTLAFTDEDRVDVVNTTEEGEPPTYDREITVEVWHPAAEGTEPGGSYETALRDGVRETTLTGRAARRRAGGGRIPARPHLARLSRQPLLMSHLGENLASKGYVAVSIDHPDGHL